MQTVGLDLGGTNMNVVVVDGDDVVRGRGRLKTPRGGDREGVIDVMFASINEACGDAGMKLEDVDAVGVGTPGVVIDGTVGAATNLPGWLDRFDLAEQLGLKVRRPVRVVNDVNAAAVAEHRLGAGRGHADVLTVFCGTGVGGGLILDDHLYEGRRGGAGEFGHMVVQQGGEVCPCGRRGCIEAYAGRAAMEHRARRLHNNGHETILFDVMREQGRERPTSGVFLEALQRGDVMVADLLDRAVSALAIGVASVVNLLDVDAVVIGGGLADKFGDWFLLRVRSAVFPALFVQPSHLQILPSELGDDAGAIGAALVARGVAG